MLLRRLTSYASHHPLYQALRELGRVVRTTFLFQYMNEEETRRRVNHQLTKIENMHQLIAELNLGKNGLIRYARPVGDGPQQAVVDQCDDVLEYVAYLQKLQELSPPERTHLLASLPDTAPLSWKHINSQGEYDFSEGTLRNLVSLELDQLLKEESKQF